MTVDGKHKGESPLNASHGETRNPKAPCNTRACCNWPSRRYESTSRPPQVATQARPTLQLQRTRNAACCSQRALPHPTHDMRNGSQAMFSSSSLRDCRTQLRYPYRDQCLSGAQPRTRAINKIPLGQCSSGLHSMAPILRGSHRLPPPRSFCLHMSAQDTCPLMRHKGPSDMEGSLST